MSSTSSSSRASSRSAVGCFAPLASPYALPPLRLVTQFGDADYVIPSVDAFIIEARPGLPRLPRPWRNTATQQ